MEKDLKTYLDEIEIILLEVEEYKNFKKKFLDELKKISKEYEQGKFDYKTYNKLKEKILLSKTKEEQIEYYNAYILSLVKKLEYLNTQVFSKLYNNETYNLALTKLENKEKNAYKTPISKKIERKIENEAPIFQKSPIQNQTPTPSQKQIPKQSPKNAIIQNEITELKEQTAPTKLNKENFQKISKNNYTQNIQTEEIITNTNETEPIKNKKEYQTPKPEELGLEEDNSLEIIQTKTETKKEKDYDIKLDTVDGQIYDAANDAIPKPKAKKNIPTPIPKKKGASGFFKSIFGEKEKDTKEKQLEFKSIINFEFIKDFVKRIRNSEEIISKDTTKGKSLLDFSELGKVDFETEAKKNPNLLIKQASQLKDLLKVRKVKIYSPSIIGTVSNIVVRKLSILLIDKFPDFFKSFYLTLRYANVKILSNTYINIMVFLSLISSVIFGAFSLMYSITFNDPITLLISKAFLMTIIGGALCAGFMIYYPNMLIKNRLKSINTNMPFAIDQMSSIVASGVPPAAMFRLLSDTKEYGDISLEIEKISNYIDIFGYDLLTAVKSISATTPSPQFKEFLDGLVSTIESGGSLKNYLSQKSQEALLSYKMERQKYVETIGTYSDIYTGVLIAAPLFFVSALSLVSVLGGKIGGYSVETVMSFGTYIIIPLLNIAFVLFLEFNQPDI